MGHDPGSRNEQQAALIHALGQDQEAAWEDPLLSILKKLKADMTASIKEG